MEHIVKRLIENKRLLEGRVGVFYMLGGHIISNSCDVRDTKAEEYGEYVNYSSHANLWSAAEHRIKSLRAKGFDMYDFPRGRVIYDKSKHKYIVYLDPFINDEVYLQLIRDKYDLSRGSYIIDTQDEHYESTEDPDDYEIKDDVIFDDMLESYLREHRLTQYTF